MRIVLFVIAIGVALFVSAGCWTMPDDVHAAPESAPGMWRVRLNWQTETEQDAFGFYLHRAEERGGPMTVINPEEPLHAAGTTTIPQRYRYYDLDVEGGRTYYYKLEQVDTDGSSRFIIGEDQPVPGEPKPLTEDEVADIRENGIMYRWEAP